MVMPRLEALATMWLPVLVGATSRRVPALTPDLAAALLPPIPPPRTRMAQLEWNYSLPYSIFYNDAGNYPPSVYDPDNASRYGFITDDVAHHHGTATFSQIEEDSLYPNFVYVSGADNVSYTSDCEKAHGMRRDSPLGALCCAKGGCVPQEADLSAIAAMAARHAEAIVPPDMAGNCVLDHEQWKPIVIPELKFAGYCPSEYMLPKSDGDWRPLPTPKTLVEGETLWWNYSLGLVQQKRPTLSLAEAEAEAAKQFLSAATAVYVTVLQAVKRARPRCHWGYWGANGLCSWHRLCTTQNATSGDPVCGFDNPAYRQLIWNFTQQQLPIVQESDALFPEIYLESPLRDSGYSLATIGYRRGEMRSVVGQAVAASNMFAGRPVLPFMRTFCYMGSMACYDRSVNSSKELSRWGIEAGLTVPYEVGAAGVVIYQEQEAVREPAQLAAQLTNVTGPLGREFLSRVHSCAASRCSGHGRCIPLDEIERIGHIDRGSTSISTSDGVAGRDDSSGCQCYAGYSGAQCATEGRSSV